MMNKEDLAVLLVVLLLLGFIIALIQEDSGDDE